MTGNSLLVIHNYYHFTVWVTVLDKDEHNHEYDYAEGDWNNGKSPKKKINNVSIASGKSVSVELDYMKGRNPKYCLQFKDDSNNIISFAELRQKDADDNKGKRFVNTVNGYSYYIFVIGINKGDSERDTLDLSLMQSLLETKMDLNITSKPASKNISYYPPTAGNLPIYDEKNDSDFIDAKRGYVEETSLTEPIKCSNGAIAWDINSYNFLNTGTCPPEINPVLWRMEKLNNINGLFEVCSINDSNGKIKRIFQVRSYDLATMTIVESDNGWIIIDPLGGVETSSAAWGIFKTKVDKDAIVKAVLITHSHVDHYKGLQGILNCGYYIMPTTQDSNVYANMSNVKPDSNGQLPIVIIAPQGFYDEALSENLYLGNCMSRRAVYMYGSTLPCDEKGHVGSGLGKSVGTETGTLLKPSFELKCKEGESFIDLTIDGLKVTFQDVPGTEAPAEFHIYFNDYNALCPGENITHTMHNLLTSRGAKVRDPKAFAKAIDDAINHFNNVNVIIGTHHWPVWDDIKDPKAYKLNCLNLMKKQRDMYRFFNDQVIRMVNKGMNMEEIAETFKLPKSLDSEYYNRGYYGTINHNVKAVVQRYVGWWDGNPANYFKYPDTEVAKRFVKDMGGEGTVLEKAKSYFLAGDYRWTVELCRQIVFYNPKNNDARCLEADALEQLGYSFESGTWRNIFLSGAAELRGIRMGDTLPHKAEDFITYTSNMLATLTPEYAFDYLSTLVDPEKIKEDYTRYFIVIEKTKFLVEIYNGVLHYKIVEDNVYDALIEYSDMSVFAKDFCDYMNGKANSSDIMYEVKYRFFGIFDTLDGQWNIIEPLQ